MSREAMQQALNTMYEVQYAILNECPREDVVLFRDAITALEAALAEQAQPVAWKHRDHREILDADPREWGRADEPWIPLYTTPPAPVVPQPLKELPPLPEPWITDTEECGTSHDGESLHQDIPLFTADQMRDYARAVEAEVLKRVGVGN